MNRARSVLRAAFGLIALISAGCASRGAAPLQPSPSSLTPVTEAAPACSQPWSTTDALALSADALRPTRHRMPGAAVAAHGCAPVNTALFRLPRFREDWTLDIDSQIDGAQLFAPEIELLDEHGRVLRELTFDRFSMRGDRLQATVFFGAANGDERFLRVRPAPQVLGQDGRRVVSGSFFIPLFNAVLPLVYMQGTESEQRYTYADQGVLNFSARSASAARRHPQAHDVARGELGGFLR